MRISELAFENAKMTAQMKTAAPPPRPPAPSKDFFNPYRNVKCGPNGYQSWN